MVCGPDYSLLAWHQVSRISNVVSTDIANVYFCQKLTQKVKTHLYIFILIVKFTCPDDVIRIFFIGLGCNSS